MRDAFASAHPITEILFFAGILLLGLWVRHPSYALLSLLFGACYLLRLRGRRALKNLTAILILVLLVTAINPLFNRLGETILFAWTGRPYTLEALLWGLSNGLTLGSVMIWFACFNDVMTEEKLLYLFGDRAPALTMVLTMVFRLIPHYSRKTTQIGHARQSIGKTSADGSRREKVQDGTAVLSALFGSALEDGVMTGDSMQARGYGSGRRSRFSMYRINRTEVLRILLIMSMVIAMVLLKIQGAAEAVFLPQVMMTGPASWLWTAGMIVYGLLLTVPLWMNLKEDIIWHRSKFKI